MRVTKESIDNSKKLISTEVVRGISCVHKVSLVRARKLFSMTVTSKLLQDDRSFMWDKSPTYVLDRTLRELQKSERIVHI